MYTKNIFNIFYFISLLSGVFAFFKRENPCEAISFKNGITNCEENGTGGIHSVNIVTSDLIQETIDKIGNHTEIEILNVHNSGECKIDNFEPLSFLTNVTEASISSSDLLPVADGILRNLKNLKKITFTDVELNQHNIYELATLTNLEKLYIRHSSCNPAIDYSPLANLTNLNELYMEAYEYHHHHYYKRLTEVPEFIFSLTNLTVVHINDQEITKFPEQFSNLKKLEHLNLMDNKIDDVLPESLNDLPELKTIILSNNVNIKGKTLTNPKLEDCMYYDNYDICKAKDMDCFKHYHYEIKSCSDAVPADEYSTNGQCGNGNGKCPPGFCCSKHGWCGKTEDHCSVTKGCQFEFGICNGEKQSGEEPQEEVDQQTIGRCGKGYGKCPSGQCCSQNGFCGITDRHCLLTQGCQSEFGVCFRLKYTVDGSCGPEAGRCPAGQCCSKYGWCGSSSSYCDAGCQSAYGTCNQI